MILTLDLQQAQARVTESDNLRQLKAVTQGDGDLQATLGGLGRIADAGHLWVDIAALKALAAPADDSAWPARYDAMIDYARDKGWVDSAGRCVRVHIE